MLAGLLGVVVGLGALGAALLAVSRPRVAVKEEGLASDAIPVLSAVIVVVLGVLLAFGLSGCSLDGAADRATFRAVAPEYLEYVQGDPGLDEGQKARRERTVVLWALRVGETDFR